MKYVSSPHRIKALSKQDSYVDITFENYWSQEDILSLQQLVLLPLIEVSIQEKNMGADRESIRFYWNESNFVLNFDCYSQSCWIEAHDNSSLLALSALYHAMV